MRYTVACIRLHRLVLVAGGFGCVGMGVGVADLGAWWMRAGGAKGVLRAMIQRPVQPVGNLDGRTGTDQGGGIEQAAARTLVMACSNWSRSASQPRALLGRRNGGIRSAWC